MHLHNFCSVTAVLIQLWPPSSQRLTLDSSAARIKQKVKVPAFPLSLPPFNSELKVQLWPLQIVSCEGICAVGVFSFFFPFFFFILHRNLLANVSWSQLSHKERCEWHCHKIIELEIVVPHSVALLKENVIYLFWASLQVHLQNHEAKNSGGVMFLNSLHCSVHSADEFLWRFILLS